jgi:hypothetical protein
VKLEKEGSQNEAQESEGKEQLKFRRNPTTETTKAQRQTQKNEQGIRGHTQVRDKPRRSFFWAEYFAFLFQFDKFFFPHLCCHSFPGLHELNCSIPLFL